MFSNVLTGGLRLGFSRLCCTVLVAVSCGLAFGAAGGLDLRVQDALSFQSDRYLKGAAASAKGNDVPLLDVCGITHGFACGNLPVAALELKAVPGSLAVSRTLPGAQIGEERYVCADGTEHAFCSWVSAKIQRPLVWMAEGYPQRPGADFACVSNFLWRTVLAGGTGGRYEVKSTPEPIDKSVTVRNAFSGKEYDHTFERAYVVFIDDDPRANWGHAARLVFVKDDLSAFTVWYMNAPVSVEEASGAVEMMRMGGTEAVVQPPDLKTVRNAVAVSNSFGGTNANVMPDGDVAHSYAILVSGGFNRSSNHTRYWGDMAAVYSTLTKCYGMTKDHIKVCMSDGTSSAADVSYGTTGSQSHGEFADNSSPLDLDGDGLDDVGYTATKDSIQSVFASMRNTLTSEDQLFVFVTDHGSQDEDTGDCYLCLWGSVFMSEEEFAELTADLPCPVVFAFEFCYSGAFIDSLVVGQDGGRAVATAANVTTSSGWTRTSKVTGVTMSQAANYMNPWVYYFVGALRGAFPSVSVSPWNASSFSCQADSTGDGRVSIREASDYAAAKIVNDGYPERPNYGDSPSGVGTALFAVKVASKPDPTTRPGNDNFAHATAISGASGSLTASSVNATKEAGEPYHGASSATNSVWWKWTASAAGSMTITTEGSGFDTGLGVYTGSSVSALTKVASNDDAESGGRWSSVTFAAVAGTTYYIAVAGYSGATGSVKLNWQLKATYTVSYMSGPYGVGTAVTDTKTEGIPLPLKGVIFTRTGYTQTGWSTFSFGISKDYNLGALYTTDAAIVLYPYWTANTYSVTYALNGGTHGTTHPASATYGTAFCVSAPTRSGYNFAGWTVTSGLNTSTAKWGTSSSPSTAISSSTTKCVNGEAGSVYFKNLTPTASGSVTLTANWTAAPTALPDLSFRYKNVGWPQSPFLSDSPANSNAVVRFVQGSSIYLFCRFDNDGASDVSVGFDVLHEVLDANGNCVASYLSEINALPAGYGTYWEGNRFSILQGLAAGEYTYRCTLDSRKTVTESNENNNVITYGFSVVSSSPSCALTTAVDNESLTFTTGGDAEWFGQGETKHDGTDAAQSGMITHSQSSWMQTTVTGPGAISFWWYASSESVGCDYLAFSIDDVQTNKIGGTSCSWTQCTYELGAGSHVLKWTYRKDGSVSTGLDAGFVDQVVWTPVPTYTVSYQPGAYGSGTSSTATKTQGIAMTLKGAVFTRTGYTQTGWSTSSTGTTKAYNLGASYTTDAAITLYPYWTANTYTVAYALNGGAHGTTHPASATYGTAFYVSAPTRSGYNFAGWTVTSGLNTSTAKWGTSSSPSTTISSSSTKCVNGATGNVYFKNLTPTAGGSVTLTANWIAVVPLSTALDNTALTFTTGGDAGWFGQGETKHDGTDAAQSGMITHSQSSWMQTTVTGPGAISFWWYASSESVNFDYLAFSIDGVQTNKIGGTSASWVRCSYELGAGSHTLKWLYCKDGSVSNGLDAGFVDQIEWVPQTSGVGAVTEITGATGGTSYLMTLAGSGSMFVVDGSWFAASRVDVSGGVTAALMNGAGRNGLPRYQSYLFGFEPESEIPAEEQLHATIAVGEDGLPIVSCSPRRESSLVRYTTLGKTSLGSAQWVEVTEANRSSMRFFKVKVEMK